MSQEEKAPENKPTESTDATESSTPQTPDTNGKGKRKKAASKVTKYTRNKEGLVEGVNYHFTEDGLVDWRKMVKSDFLVVNPDRFPEDVNIEELNVEELEDTKLLILLGGIKDLAQLRGYRRVSYDVVHYGSESAAVKCKIEWLPNFETMNEEVSFESFADANIENTNSFGREFLLAIAENRAFTRAVRNFLRIQIVGKDELGKNKKGTQGENVPQEGDRKYSPCGQLEKLIEGNPKINFETIKNRLIKEGAEEAENWTKLEDIPPQTVYKLIHRIKKVAQGESGE